VSGLRCVGDKGYAVWDGVAGERQQMSNPMCVCCINRWWRWRGEARANKVLRGAEKGERPLNVTEVSFDGGAEGGGY